MLFFSDLSPNLAGLHNKKETLFSVNVALICRFRYPHMGATLHILYICHPWAASLGLVCLNPFCHSHWVLAKYFHRSPYVLRWRPWGCIPGQPLLRLITTHGTAGEWGWATGVPGGLLEVPLVQLWPAPHSLLLKGLAWSVAPGSQWPEGRLQHRSRVSSNKSV